jgi:hypothetical protein
MGTNCAPLLADIFLYSYEAEFVQKLLRDNNKKLAVSFNDTFRYIDDVLSINNHNPWVFTSISHKQNNNLTYTNILLHLYRGKLK